MSKDELVKEWNEVSDYSSVLEDSEVNHLLINENKVLSYNNTKGVSVETKELKKKVKVKFVIEKGVKVSKPVHLCFGVLKKRMTQLIDINLIVEKNASVKVLAHCIFPNPTKVVHRMKADIIVEDDASFTYEEIHYHGKKGETIVEPIAVINLGKNAVYNNTFKLLKGKAGEVNFDYEVTCGENSSADLTAKINARDNDSVKITERAFLTGEGSKALLNTRMVLNDEASGEVVNEITATGENCRGHMDCVEVLNGSEASAKAVPIVDVSNDSSKVTHEAAIGSVDKESLNTLMSRGLTRKEAVEVVIKGLLK